MRQRASRALRAAGRPRVTPGSAPPRDDTTPQRALGWATGPPGASVQRCRAACALWPAWSRAHRARPRFAPPHSPHPSRSLKAPQRGSYRGCDAVSPDPGGHRAAWRPRHAGCPTRPMARPPGARGLRPRRPRPPAGPLGAKCARPLTTTLGACAGLAPGWLRSTACGILPKRLRPTSPRKRWSSAGPRPDKPCAGATTSTREPKAPQTRAERSAEPVVRQEYRPAKRPARWAGTLTSLPISGSSRGSGNAAAPCGDTPLSLANRRKASVHASLAVSMWTSAPNSIA